MRLDRVQVAVRPRNVLECLDLAVLVCGRRPLGIAAAAAIGALPSPDSLENRPRLTPAAIIAPSPPPPRAEPEQASERIRVIAPGISAQCIARMIPQPIR